MEYNQTPASQIKRLCAPLYEARGWIKFVGVLSFISGGLQVLSCWGIIIAWLPIWMGVILFSVAKNIERAYHTEQEQDVLLSMNNLKSYFKLLGIFIIIFILVAVIAMGAAIVIPFLAQSRRVAG